jgi:hypothetical protein
VNATTTRVSKYSPLSLSPTWNISFNCSLAAYALNSGANPASSQLKHVLLSFKGYLLLCHGNSVDYTTGSTGVLSQGCRFPTNQIIKTACTYGNLVAIGTSDNLFDNTYRGNARVYLYDGFSLDWMKEIIFPDNDITNIDTFKGELYAWGPRGMYHYNGSGFDIVRSAALAVSHGSTDKNAGAIFFKGANVIYAYGSPDPSLPPAFYTPMTGSGTNGIVRWVNPTTLIATADDATLSNYNSSFNETTVSWNSRLIMAGNGQKFSVKSVKITSLPLASGDAVSVNLIDEAGNTCSVGAFTYSGDNSVNNTSKLFLEENFVTPFTKFSQGVQVQLSFTSGSIQVLSVDLCLETVPEV